MANIWSAASATKRLGGLFGIAAATAAAVIGPDAVAHSVRAERVEPDSSVRLVANLGERKLYIRQGDSTIVTYAIAIGRGSKPTPTGKYLIRRIVWNPAWTPPPNEEWAKNKKPQAPGASANPMKVVKIFFKEPDYYIHGTGELESLGEAASHGCLRMDPDDAYNVARFVMEHGGQPRDESWFWRVLHFRSETKTVNLDHPVPISVDD